MSVSFVDKTQYRVCYLYGVNHVLTCPILTTERLTEFVNKTQYKHSIYWWNGNHDKATEYCARRRWITRNKGLLHGKAVRVVTPIDGVMHRTTVPWSEDSTRVSSSLVSLRA